MDYKTLQTKFERELLLQIVASMRKKRLNKKGAKEVAKAFLPAMAIKDEAAFIVKTGRLCEFYPEIMEAFLVTIKEYEDELKIQNLRLVREEMKGGETYGSN